jgi:hypothetical protein
MSRDVSLLIVAFLFLAISKNYDTINYENKTNISGFTCDSDFIRL